MMLGTGGIDHIIQTHPLLGEVIESLPGYTRAATVAREARQLRDAVVRPDPVESPLETAEPVADWVERTDDARRAVREADERRSALHNLAQEADHRAGGIVSADAEALLLGLGLRRHLDALLVELADVVRRLAGATIAAEAIRVGSSEAWRELERILDRHNAIRQAQSTVMSHYFESAAIGARPARDFSDDAMVSDLWLANLDELWADWRNPIATSFKIHGPQDRLEPWTADLAEQLVWMVTNGAAPWLPTAGDLKQLNDSRHNGDVPRPQPEVPWLNDDQDDELTNNEMAESS